MTKLFGIHNVPPYREYFLHQSSSQNNDIISKQTAYSVSQKLTKESFLIISSNKDVADVFVFAKGISFWC